MFYNPVSDIAHSSGDELLRAALLRAGQLIFLNSKYFLYAEPGKAQPGGLF
jgi:hypothetical protein